MVALIILALLLQPAVKNHSLWKATVTPLASIIGSGFLVVAPLLAVIVGGAAPWAMVAIVVIAYAIGGISRFNIRYGEPLLKKHEASRSVRMAEHISNLMLSIAYIVSVTFYLRLMASFVFKSVAIESILGTQILTTIILIGIGFSGWFRGLNGMVRLEEYSVSIKLAIIAALLLGLFNYDVMGGFSNDNLSSNPQSVWLQVRQLAGMLLVVQGFETSRYLGAEFSPELRIRSMKFAQLIAGLIYIAFIILITPLFFASTSIQTDETAVFGLVAQVSLVLPAMLLLAAIMSQFSAAISDTAAAGGLVEEESQSRVTAQYAYLAIVGLSIFLVWTADIFEIITLASRAFAAYYFIQAIVAFQVSGNLSDIRSRWSARVAFALASIFLAGVVIFAIPVG